MLKDMKYFSTTIATGVLAGLLLCQPASAAIALDRTRVIFPGGERSISLKIRNENKELPFLAQAWLEDAKGNKVISPIVVVPPLQRVEPGAPGQVEIRALPAAAALPQDRESLFYFNLREIPPRSSKPNTLQLALQTRVKFFYRPKSIQLTRTEMATPWQNNVTLTRQGEHYVVNNPTPYYISFVAAGATEAEAGGRGRAFHPLMVEPKASGMLNLGASVLGNAPVLTYINDYGGSKMLMFRCSGDLCQVGRDKVVKG